MVYKIYNGKLDYIKWTNSHLLSPQGPVWKKNSLTEIRKSIKITFGLVV